jgi:selenoprotein W-related protein
LVPGKGGIFQVHVGEELVAQRTREHFPDTEEIVTVVEKALA